MVLRHSNQKKQEIIDAEPITTEVFNFEDMEVKINYAKARLAFAIIFGSLYMFYSLIISLFSTNDINEVKDYHASKSFILFLIIAMLTLIRDKYEMLIAKQ